MSFKIRGQLGTKHLEIWQLRNSWKKILTRSGWILAGADAQKPREGDSIHQHPQDGFVFM